MERTMHITTRGFGYLMVLLSIAILGVIVTIGFRFLIEAAPPPEEDAIVAPIEGAEHTKEILEGGMR